MLIWSSTWDKSSKMGFLLYVVIWLWRLCCTLRWWQLNPLASHPCVKHQNQNTCKSESNHLLSECKDLQSSQRNNLCLDSSCFIWPRSTSLQSGAEKGIDMSVHSVVIVQEIVFSEPLDTEPLNHFQFPVEGRSKVLRYSTGPALMTFYAANCRSKCILFLWIFVLLQVSLLFTLASPFDLLTKGS